MNRKSYKNAIIYDKRTYWSFLKSKQLLLFSFIPNNDYNSKTVKISIFFFSFSLYFAINSLFFIDKTMHNIYLDKGKYNFIYQLPNIIYSNLISTVINTIIYKLSLSEKYVLNLKNKKNEQNLMKCL